MMNKYLGWMMPLALLQLSFGSKSSQASATTTSTTTQVSDRRVVADGTSVVVGDGASASVSNVTTDLGAIQRAFDMAEKVVIGSTSLATEQNAASGKLAVTAIGELKSAYASANEQAQAVASGNKTLAIVGMVVAGVVAFASWNGSLGNK